MKNLNIVLSINVRWWNAEAAYAVNVARIFRQKGHRVWLIVNANSPVEKKALEYGLTTITQVELDTLSIIKQVNNLRWLFKFIDREKIDIINSFKSNGAILFSIIKRYRPRVIYIKTRGEARPPKKNMINRFLYGRSGCHGVITVGSTVEQWVRDLGLTHQKIKTIYYGDSPVSPAPEYPDPDQKKKIIVIVGRTQKIKGHMYLLKALAKLNDRSLQLWFLVKDLLEFPHELEEIKQFIKLEHLERQVKILGFQKDLENILNKVHLGVIPSVDSEVNCRVVVELFSMGIPILAFPTGTLPDLIKHESNGYLCRNRSVEELGRGIRYIFSQDCDYSRLRKKALDSYRSDYTLEKLFDETFRFYLDQK